MEDMGPERTSQERTSSCSPGFSPLGLVVTTGNPSLLLVNTLKTSLSLVNTLKTSLLLVNNNLNSALPPLATGAVAGAGSWSTVRDKNSY